MQRPIFLDTSALANPVTAAAYGIGLYPNAVLLKSICREIERLSYQLEKQAVAQQASHTVLLLLSLSTVTVRLDQQEPTAAHPDTDLLARAHQESGAIMTMDHALQDAARAQGIEVIAVQAIYRQLRQGMPRLRQLFPPPQALAVGDIIPVHITTLGQQPGVGRGRLLDGRAVVVHDGAGYLGQTIDVKVTGIKVREGGRETVFAVPGHALAA
jgi:rRNA-processing protein FCF1